MLHMRKNKNNYYLKVFYTEPFPEDLSTCKAYDQHNIATHVALFARLLQVIFFFWIIFRTPGGVYKKISDCCHDIHKGAYITLICRQYYIQYLRISSASH